MCEKAGYIFREGSEPATHRCHVDPDVENGEAARAPSEQAAGSNRRGVDADAALTRRLDRLVKQLDEHAQFLRDTRAAWSSAVHA